MMCCATTKAGVTLGRNAGRMQSALRSYATCIRS